MGKGGFSAARLGRFHMVTILMTQRTWDTPSPPEILRDFLTSAYQAIGD